MLFAPFSLPVPLPLLLLDAPELLCVVAYVLVLVLRFRRGIVELGGGMGGGGRGGRRDEAEEAEG